MAINQLRGNSMSFRGRGQPGITDRALAAASPETTEKSWGISGGIRMAPLDFNYAKSYAYGASTIPLARTIITIIISTSYVILQINY